MFTGIVEEIGKIKAIKGSQDPMLNNEDSSENEFRRMSRSVTAYRLMGFA